MSLRDASFDPSDPYGYRHEDETWGVTGRMPPEEEAELNDGSHLLGCDCPGCLPEAYDVAERAAGRSDRQVAA